MKLFLAIAVVAIVAVVVLAMQRGGTRVTTIETRRDRDGDRDGGHE